ncbi:zinc finger protein 410-like [Lineus longissimus]|uniref:zinc finger protein 410-like n=1 Tax=Lineus longissimus TaxID=88925 RepID=UPI00315CC5CE
MATGTIDLPESPEEENEMDETNIIATMETVVADITNFAAVEEEAKNEASIELQKLPTLPLMYAYTTANGSQFIRIDAANQIVAPQCTPVNSISDKAYIFVQDTDSLPKVGTTSTIVDQANPVLVLNNTGRGVFEANVVFDQCRVQPGVQSQTSFQSLQALAHANLLQQTQEKIAKDLGVDLPDSEQRKQEFVCDVDGCGRGFSTMGYMKCHQAVHNGNAEKTLKCNVHGCNKTFSWPAHLKYHQLTHTGERLYQCGFEGCGQRFYTAQRLQVHYRTHSGERPFICPEKGCRRSFSTAGNLKNHSRVHTGERPYVCTVEGCWKCFAEHSSLRKHKLVHSGEKPFSCDICGKTFTQSGSRNVHMKRNHLNKTPEQDGAQTQPSNVYVELADQDVLVLRQNDEDTRYQDFQGAEPVVLSEVTGDHVLALTDHVVTVSTQSSDEHIDLPGTILGTEEILHDHCIQTDSGLVTSSGTNVVVLSQPQDIMCSISGFPSQVGHQEEIVYDTDLLETGLGHEVMADPISGGSIIGDSGISERPCKSGMDPMMELDDI